MYVTGAFLLRLTKKIIKTMEYQKSFAEVARAVLSKPFKSKQHVCHAIGITVSNFDQWVAEIEEFANAVSEGFLTGEVGARDFLAQAGLIQSKRIDIKVYLKLAEDIYGIGTGNGEADNEEPVRWLVEFVGSKSENT